MPSRVNWPVMGGPTAHPTGVTLALGDPPRSLNAPGGSPGCCLVQEAREPDLWVGHERFPRLAGATNAAAESERCSDRRSGLPHRIGSSVEDQFYSKLLLPIIQKYLKIIPKTRRFTKKILNFQIKYRGLQELHPSTPTNLHTVTDLLPILVLHSGPFIRKLPSKLP